MSTQWWLRADRWRPWAVLVLLSVIPLVLFLYAADRILRSYTTRTLSQQSLTAADLAGRSLQEHLVRAESFLTALAAQPELLKSWQRGDLEAVDRQLRQACQLQGEFALCGVRDQAGIRVIYPQLKQLPKTQSEWTAIFFQRPRPYVSGVYQPTFDPGHSYVAVAVPLAATSAGAPDAMVFGLFPLSVISAWLKQAVPSGTKWITVVDQNGAIVTEPDVSGYRIPPHIGDYAPVQQVLAGQSLTDFHVYGGQRVLVTGHPVPLLHWGVLVQVPMAEVDQAIWRFERPLAIAGLIFLGMAFLFGNVGAWLYRRLRAREHGLRAQLLTSSQQKYEALFNASPQPMWVYDLETLRFLDVNQTAIDQYGYSRKVFLAMTLRDLRAPEEVPALLDTIQAIGDAPYVGIARHRRRDGKLIDVEIKQSPLQLDGCRAALVLATDITEKRQMEAQLRQVQKMEGIGQLAGGVAHDFNNILMVIVSYSDLLQERAQLTGDFARYLAQIHQAAERAVGITRQLLAFSRQQVLAPKVLDPSKALVESMGILKRLLGEHIRFIFKPGANVRHIMADPVQLGQVVMNLAVNARDAMPRGGDLSVEVANVELDEQYCMAHHPVQPGKYVMLSVSDTGEGMDAETQKRIFEPFFTTKAAGKGTGLGLSTVYGIVKQSGGYIWVYSEPAIGSVFKIYFPQVTAAPSEQPAPVRETEPARTTATILLVEDEQDLAQVEGDYLRDRGYTILRAITGTEAFEIAQQTKAIDLLVSDVVLPGMNGRELAEKVQRMHPETRVLFMSGYTADSALLHDIAEGERFLQKPFTLAALGKMVREVLKDGS